MKHRTGPRPPRPLDQAQLEQLALAYVGRFATSRARLVQFLERKLRERGWGGDGAPEAEVIAERMRHAGYVDDQAYALARARGLLRRGYGARRVADGLRVAGIGDEHAAAALQLADEEALSAALAFARRRRIGPFATAPPDPRTRERLLVAMIRAGHRFALARAIVDAGPGEEIAVDQLAG